MLDGVRADLPQNGVAALCSVDYIKNNSLGQRVWAILAVRQVAT